MSVSSTRSLGGSVRLQPYVPRLVIEWLRESPERTYRQVDGSLAFVDVSGFTNLTERLSRRGKVGAEEMNQILNECFTACLASAYEFGAGVIKWGGDAVLLLFDGDRHQRRACRAAFEMQRTMRRVGRIRTGSGSVTLRMSIGVHSGLLDFFLVGDLHRELVVTGPAATRTVAIEGIADAGEIAISPETAAAIDPRDLGGEKETAILLRRGPEIAGERGETVAGAEALDLASCVPVSVREHLLAGGAEPEHRLMTAAFVHVMGADELLAREGADWLSAALAVTLDALERVALEYGVAFFDSDIYLGGAKVMLMAGAPVSTGVDEERMLRAMRAVLDADLPLPLRIGVTRGRIFVGDFGPDYRRTYTVTGDSVNLAARLMARAEPGQMLATDGVLAHSRTAFQAFALEPFRAKGKTEPVQASAVGAALARTSRRPSAPLVGREDELETLLQAFRAAAGGSGRIVEIVAEPGMGKSRLIEELRARATPIHWVAAECDEYETATPYHPFATIVRALLGLDAGDEHEASSLRAAVETAAPHLTPFLPLVGVPLGIELPDTAETRPLEDRFRRERVHEVTAELLGMLLLEPTLILFEDAHWMDEASADLLRSLLAELDLRPWLIVITRREQASGFAAPAGSKAAVIALQPLAPDQASALLHATTGETPLLPHEVEVLAERSGGNPLLLGELLATARQAGGIEGLPDSIESLMTAQIDRLSPTDRRLLRSAAVIGTVFTADVLAEALREAPDTTAWRRLGDFLVDEGNGQRRFRHALLRDAAYEGLPYRRRRELHRRVGETIEDRAGDRSVEDAELLSLHFFHAHAFDKAWRYSRVAGERAASIYANVEAVAMLRRAIESVRHVPDVPSSERAAVWETLGDVTLRLSEFDRSEAAYRAARRSLSGSHIEEARLLQKEAMVPVRLGRHSNALRRLNRGWRRLEGVEGLDAAAQRARLFAWCGTVRQYQRRPQDAIEWCRRAMAEGERSQALDALAQAYFILDWAYLALGAPEEAGYSARAIEIYEELGDLDRLASVINNLGGWAYLDGRWEEALELSERARQALVRIGDRVSASIAAFNSAEIRADQGKVEGLELVLRDVLRVQKAAGNLFDVALTTSVLGRQLARAGRFDEAEALLDEARGLFEAEGDDVELLTTRARRVEWLVLQCESTRAVALTDECLEDAASIEGVSIQVAMLHRLRGWALAQLGDLVAAREALDRSLEVATLRDENFGIRSGDYEAALALDALVKIGRLESDSIAGLEDRRDAILERLGVVAIPKLPLPAD